MIVRKGGTELLLLHKEEVPGDHVTNEVILQSLGISPEKEDEDIP